MDGDCVGGGASGATTLARTQQGPGKVMDGSAGFQQFFLMYDKLIIGLSDSKVRVSSMTP